MAIYYHVSVDLDHSGIFTPRIPMDRAYDEDSHIQRVCVSTSIEGALTAMPGGSSSFAELVKHQQAQFKIFKIDTDKLSLSNSSLISNQILFEDGLVNDANLTGEVWITSQFAVPIDDQCIIVVKDWHEEECDVIPHYIYERAEDDTYNGDYLQCYMDIVEPRVPCSLIINNLAFEKIT